MTYQQLASSFPLPWCGGILPTGHYCHAGDHRVGFTDRDGRIHFSDRPTTRANTFTFIKLAAQAIDPSVNDDVPWRRVYRIAAIARELCVTIHFRPGHLWDFDKAFVRAGIAGLSNDVPHRLAAYDWSRR